MKYKRLFLPIPENDYTPHLLQRAAMVMMLILVLLSFTVVNLQALLWQSSNWLVGTVLPAVVVELTNEERTELAAVPLRRNALLDEAARLKAEHMARESYFAHYSPDGVSPWYWFEQVSYTYAHAGENLAIHFNDSDAVVDAWMKSPTHRANIVKPEYTEIGVGTAKGMFDGYETVFVVQLFGTPAAPVPPTVPVAVAVSPVAPALPLATEVVEEAPASALVPVREPVPAEEVAGEESVVEEEIPAPPVFIAEVIQESEQTSVFSSHVATSSGLPPVAVGSVSGTTAESVSFMGALATRPSVALQTIYITIGMLIAVLLLVSVVIGINNTRPLQVVYGVGLLMLMSGLFYVHAALTTSVVIAAEQEVEMLML